MLGNILSVILRTHDLWKRLEKHRKISWISSPISRQKILQQNPKRLNVETVKIKLKFTCGAKNQFSQKRGRVRKYIGKLIGGFKNR